MGKKAKVFGIIITMVVVFIVWNVAMAAIQAPIKKDMAVCDQKLKLLDQKSLALDHGNQEQADQIQLQIDNIKGCG
jgi:hypothetical protein